MHFINTDEVIEDRIVTFLNYLKEPIFCEVIYKTDGTEKRAEGYLRLLNDGNDQLKKVLVKNDKEEIVIGINDVIRIKRQEAIVKIENEGVSRNQFLSPVREKQIPTAAQIVGCERLRPI